GIVVKISPAYSVVAARRLNVGEFIRDVTRVRTPRVEKPVSITKSIVPVRVGPPVYVSGYESLREIESSKKEIRALASKVQTRSLVDDESEKISDEIFLARLQKKLNKAKSEKKKKSDKKEKKK
ncbi:MAG: hypothetical protein KAG97_11015, partial [Victivallales bacterium]|nr:hypothetical protein [Victivallales bacterium]